MRPSFSLASLAGAAVCACGPGGVTGDPSASRVIVLFDETPDPVLAAASPFRALTEVPPAWLQKQALFRAFPQYPPADELAELPMVVLDGVDDEALTALQGHPLVAATWREAQLELTDVESFAHIAQPAAAAAGLTGAGTSVAVLDTGLDYRKPEFGTCPAPGAAGCFVPVVRDFAPDDGALDANGHGTNVAAIVRGVAGRARVIGLDVFTGTSASSAHIISAINWVVANRSTHNIVAMNLSLGGGSSTTTCPQDVFAVPIATARAAGVLAAIASGNDARSTSMSSPACVPEAISVGAVYDSNVGRLSTSVCTDASSRADQVACFSNSAAFLSLWAPGVAVSAGGFTMSGTSQATPHVAGALAVLAAKYPSDSASTRATRLLSGATQVRDVRNGFTRPRLTMGATFGACSVSVAPTATLSAGGGATSLTVTATPSTCAWAVTGAPSWLTATTTAQAVTFSTSVNPGAQREATVQVAGALVRVSQAADTTPPQGTLQLPALSRTASVTATLTASDPSGVNGVCLSTATTCTAFVPFTTSAVVTLPAGDGTKTLRAWLRDGRGNVTPAPVTATTVLDTTAPANGRLSGTAAAGAVTLRWSGFSDATSGVASYRLVRSTSATVDAPAGCSTGLQVASGSATTASVTLASKTTARFRVCAVDGAGNVSSGATFTVTMP